VTAADDVARVLTLVPWLLERPGVSVDEAAAAFGVDRATIAADVDLIGYCGRPPLGGGDLFEASIVGDRIVVTMADELRHPVRLAPAEALRIVLAGEAAAAALGDDVPDLRSALTQLRRAAGVPEHVAVLFDEDGEALIGPLRDAIADDRQVRLEYQGRVDASPQARVVDPWALHVTDGSWYLQGWDHGAAGGRNFRLDRIADLERLDDARAHPARPIAPPRYEAGVDDITVELRLGPADRWLADDVAVDERVDEPGGGLRIRFRTDALGWVAALLLEAGPGVEVITPKSLAVARRDRATAALARYEPIA